MAGVLHVYKIVCSKLCPRCSHKPLCAIHVILECFYQSLLESTAKVPCRQVAKPANCSRYSFLFLLKPGYSNNG